MSDNPQATGFKRFSSTSFGAPDRFRAFFMERYGDSYRLEIEAFVNGLVQGQPASVSAIDGLAGSLPCRSRRSISSNGKSYRTETKL